jgi:hypothetical protein
VVWEETEKRLREFLPVGRADESPWNRLVGTCLLGVEPFLKQPSPYVEEKVTLTEISHGP